LSRLGLCAHPVPTLCLSRAPVESGGSADDHWACARVLPCLLHLGHRLLCAALVLIPTSTKHARSRSRTARFFSTELLPVRYPCRGWSQQTQSSVLHEHQCAR